MVTTTEDVRNHLQPIIDTLQADGFELAVRLTGRTVEVEVIGDAAACAECLVPQPVFRSIVEDALQPLEGDVDASDVRITYPTV